MKSTLLGGGWVGSYGFSRTVLALSGALTLAAACGDEAAEPGVNTGGATANTTGGSTGATTGASTGSDDTDAGATGGSSTGGTTAATTGGSTGTSTGATTGTTPDAGMMSVPDNPSTPGNDSPTATACKGATSCGFATQTCCVQGVGDAMCIEGKKCPAGGLFPSAPTVCDGPEDCGPKKVCCVAVNADGATNSCQDSCDKVKGLVGVWQLCHKDGDCPAAKGACEADSTFPYWGFCG